VYNQALYEEILYNQNVSILSDDISIPGTQDPTKTVIPETSLFIPDAFSPNEDGINDKFVIVHPTQMKIEFEVFNRWDNKVFSSKDYQNDWDGKGTSNFLGRELPNGTYYCVYKAINTISGEVVTKGVKYITLRR
jgi:gliding motility-associated-like protein